jgi:putative heme-binding domain-containing protein
MRMLAVRSIIFVLAAATLAAQHTYSPGDIEEGRRLFRTNCVLCHGPEGDQIPGIDLSHGKYRQSYSDETLLKIIEEGKPGTPMPPTNLRGFQAEIVLAYLRSIGSSGRSAPVHGDAARGKAIFDGKGGCTQCHRVGTAGSRVGPDLSDIGALRRTADLEQSLLEPNAEILPQNRYYRAVTRQGQTVTGRLLNIDTFTVQILDTKEHLVSLQRSDLRESAFLENSPMPSYRGKLSDQELADVVTYLVSLKGI